MKLKDIIQDCGATLVSGTGGREIRKICTDSRQAEPDTLFIAVKGFAGDGHDYIAAAVRAGAVAVAYEDETALRAQLETVPDRSVACIKMENGRHAVARMADNFYGHPSRRLALVGITGTNGKTTTVTLLYRLFTALGYHCGLLSTVANYVGSTRLETENTTPDPITINALLDRMVREGCAYCFMEVSSIGVEQERVTGLTFKAGIFSNLTHDHLDYHKTFAEYLRCKQRFFDLLPADAVAITNIDDRNGEVMVQNTRARIVRYACRRPADHVCSIKEQILGGSLLEIDGQEVWTKLCGEFNAYNVLAAYCAALALGADPKETLVAASTLEAAPGRLETISGPKGMHVVIDYAHTPDALENVLRTLKKVGAGHTLICCFGCGGDRDRTKRPEMAAAAERYADRIVVTSDNSRTERTEDIMEEIRAGFSPAGLARAIFIADRREAIRTALVTAPEGAVVLLAGKGHETYQIIGKERRHFDEREVVAAVFAEMEPGMKK